MTDTERYIAFLKYSIDEQAPYPDFLEEMDWDGLAKFGVEQAVFGVLYYGLNRIPQEVPHRPHRRKVAEWVGLFRELQKKNEQVNKDAARVTSFFYSKFGVKSCVLKGQSNTGYYPDPFMRTPGDIDLWTDQDEDTIMRIAHSIDKDFDLDYHHIEVSGLVPTSLEVHLKPSFMVNPWYEKRLDRYFEQMKPSQFKQFLTLPGGRKICVVDRAFNRVFQLTHLQHHFFGEGVGFRQIIDYYYLLRQGFSAEEKENTMQTLKYLHMTRFAAGMMWVLHEVLGLDEKYLLTQPDEKVGRLLYSEVLKAGNFGHADKRYNFGGKSRWSYFFLETWRNMHFVLYFPAETLWGRPLARIMFAVHKRKLRRNLEKSLRSDKAATK